MESGRITGEFAFNQFVVLNNDGYTKTKFKAVFKAHGIKAVADARRAKSNAHSTLPPLR